MSHNTEIPFFRLSTLVSPQPDFSCQLQAEGDLSAAESCSGLHGLGRHRSDGPSPEQNCIFGSRRLYTLKYKFVPLQPYDSINFYHRRVRSASGKWRGGVGEQRYMFVSHFFYAEKDVHLERLRFAALSANSVPPFLLPPLLRCQMSPFTCSD